ncbi:hypothetical protein K4A76_06865 [Pseudomonas sp. NEEL19]|uniref:hypothetical protein n=1 Tax=Pseudomonas sp. NEEL19 TaxID=2867409 RepID=UPI0023678D9B|nr:hypothetical protein [Pseudomonas sp. NEEL19]WDM60654.1 hypothetical protein K4A76_06865 [Pseudomonas sp. NEEL19]
MTSLFSHLSESELRAICKNKIESLEHWLRRLIDDSLNGIYGDYFSYEDTNGNRLIKKETARIAETRQRKEPSRYPRKIDAVLLEEAIEIICKPELFKTHFKTPLAKAFPDGREEAKTFLSRILTPRNNLAHANPISLRAAEQVICYSNDVMDSLKDHYRLIGMQQEYDVPLILRITDSFGKTFTRSELGNSQSGGIYKNFTSSPSTYLRPGDTLTVELEIDPTYDPASYEILWTSTKPLNTRKDTPRLALTIENVHVGVKFDIQCRITTKRSWHRMSNGCDDLLVIHYKVLPPLG